MAEVEFRWRRAEEEAAAAPVLFDADRLLDRHVGTGEFAGMEFIHVNARRIINEVPEVSRVPFRWTINAYRGCSHACTYCLSGDTPILMGDGSTKPLADVGVGDEVHGTVRSGSYRRYAVTQVLAHWSTVKPAYRVTLEDGTELVSSGDHRFLTDRGWKHVTGTECGAAQRHHLTRQDKLIGTCGSGPPSGREALVCSDLHDSPRLQVASVDPLGVDLPMFDITTGTGDFVASGVVSHNCFARPTHEYLGLGIGEDFEKKIVVKVNAVERLRAELAAKRWSGQHIAMGTNTDPYQRCEGKYHLTRGIVRALGEAGNPFSILTKSTLVLRDLDLLKQAASRTEVHCNLSIGTLDEQVWRLTEPGTPHPRRRVEAVRRLNEAGIPCGVLVAPILPGLSDGDDQLEEVVTACVAAGATSISPIALHLRPGVRDHFLAWLRATRPRMAADYERRYRRSYLPSNEQAGLAERVRRFADAARGPVRVSPPAGMRGLEARGERSHLAPSSPPSRQLDLGL